MTLIRCKDCLEIKQSHSVKGDLCQTCYNRKIRKRYYKTHTTAKVHIGGEFITETFDKTQMVNGDAEKFVRYKRKEILADMLKNPRKYLDEA